MDTNRDNPPVARPMCEALARDAIWSLAADDDVARFACASWPAEGLGLGRMEIAHLIGQSSVESGGFSALEENLNYSVSALQKIFSFYRDNPALAQAHGRKSGQRANQEAIANHAYAFRIGNGSPETGDGWKYRGRGWIQITGRANYRRYGEILSLPLEQEPDLAAKPEIAWRIAAAYFEHRIVRGMTLFAHARLDNRSSVTLGVNGAAMHDANRRSRNTQIAIEAVSSEPSISALQAALNANGFSAGAVDGIAGRRTNAAINLATRELKTTRADLYETLMNAERN